ncbi:MAG: MoaD/ThiS family protein [Sciscionella sp.]
MASSVQLCYYAGARAAAGVSEERIELPEPVTIATVLDAVVARRGPALHRVLAVCSFLLDGTAVHDRDAAVPNGAQLDVLPPFAGG